MATYIADTLNLIDGLVADYAETVFNNFGGPLTTTIQLAGILSLALLAANAVLQITPLRLSDFARWGVRYVVILSVATTWSQFLPIYDIITNIPASVGAALLGASGNVDLNMALDEMVTAVFDFSDRAAEESGFLSINLLSVLLGVLGAIMACVAILVSAIAKVGLAMAVSLAPIFIASLLFKATSDLFSTWAKFTLGFALIPMVLAGVMGAVLRIGQDMIIEVQGSNTLTQAAPFIILTLAAIFLMSQVPTLVNGLAGSIVATGSGLAEGRAAAGKASGAIGSVAGAVSTVSPALGAAASIAGAAARADSGSSAKAALEQSMAIGRATRAAQLRNLDRMANLGRRPTMGQQFEAGQAGLEQFLRQQKQQRAAASEPGDTLPQGNTRQAGSEPSGTLPRTKTRTS